MHTVNLRTVIAAAGPGTVEVAGQQVTWEVRVSAGESVTLTIQARAIAAPSFAVNMAIFSSTQVLTREAATLIYGNQLYLPVILKQSP